MVDRDPITGMDLNQLIVYKLGQIESKLDDALESVDDHEDRIGVLEAAHYKTIGAASAVSVFISFIAWIIQQHG